MIHLLQTNPRSYLHFLVTCGIALRQNTEKVQNDGHIYLHEVCFPRSLEERLPGRHMVNDDEETESPGVVGCSRRRVPPS